MPKGQTSLKGLPRATHSTDRAQTSGNVTPRVELCSPSLTFRIKVRAREMCPKKRGTAGNYTYTYKAPLRGVGRCSRGDARLQVIGRHGLKRKVVSYLGTAEVAGCWTIPIKAPDRGGATERPGVPDQSGDRSRRKTKLSHLCGLDPPCVVNAHYIPPRESQVPVYIFIIRQQPLKVRRHVLLYQQED